MKGDLTMSFYREYPRKTRTIETNNVAIAPSTGLIHCERLSEKQVKESMQRLHDEMKSYRLRREKDMDDSMEFAKHYTCK